MSYLNAQRFKYIPNVNDLIDNQNAYYLPNLNHLRSALTNAFKNGDQIPLLPLTFFSMFIDKQANLYTGKFKREGLDNYEDKIDLFSLNAELIYLERFFHIASRAGLYFFGEDNQIRFEALEAIDYFKEGDYCFIQDEDYKVLIYQQFEGKILGYEITKRLIDDTKEDVDFSLYDLVTSWDLNVSLELQLFFVNASKDGVQYIINQFDTAIEGEPLKEIPLMEISSRNNKVAKKNNLIGLENNYVIGMSLGSYMALPKMIPHVTAFTDMDRREAEKALDGFGRRNTVTVFGSQDKMMVFDAGDVTVLESMTKIFNGFIEQQCRIKGVDFHAIMPNYRTGNDVESGEAKKQTLRYINEYRRDFYKDFEKFERDFFELVGIVFGLTLDVKIKFEDKELTNTRKESLDYVILATDNDFMTRTKGYAIVNDLTISEAEKEIKASDFDENDDDEKDNKNKVTV